MDQPSIFTASVPDHLVSGFIERKLQPQLPYSLPLCRRCQFHLRNVSKEQDRRSNPGQPEVWVAVARPNLSAVHDGGTSLKKTSSSTQAEWLSTWLAKEQADVTTQNQSTEEWLAVHIDLRTPGTTQIWAFGSWEREFAEQVDKPSSTFEAKSTARIALFQALFIYLRTHHIPPLPNDPPLEWQTLLSSGKTVSKPYQRSKVLFGALAEPLWPYLDDDVVHMKQLPSSTSTGRTLPNSIAREDRPYLKYLIDLSSQESPLSQSSSAPPGFHFGTLSNAQLQLMLDRSPIPRTIELLKSLVSVGLFADGVPDPIAWGVLAKDASLASLHTEPEYRGKGLAEYVVNELIRRMDGTFHSRYLQGGQGDDESQPAILYAHGDVSTSNMASRRVFEKMGGKVAWKVGWIEVYVGEIDPDSGLLR